MARRRGQTFPALTALGPATAYVATLLVGPFLFLSWISLQDRDPFLHADTSFTLRHYGEILSNRLYADSLWGTLQLGVSVTALTLLLGYPVAYFVARSGSRLAGVVMTIVILPLFVSVVVRSFGWLVLLGRQGVINRTLMALGITEEPLQLLYSWGAVTVGLVHILAPLMILPIASVLRNMDPAVPEAARSLGASRAGVFWTVTLPLSLPGVAAGCLLVLAHVIAAFVLPALIGSDRIRLMATMIWQQTMVANNVPLGAALAVAMVAASFLLLGLAGLAGRRWHG
jgi:putative spermidine/putrescine transport system permease protein